jgi:uncharacterized Zn finger protein
MKKCPRCGKEKMRDEEIKNASSRRDNKTYICSDCGTAEALIDSGFVNAKNNPDEFENDYYFLRKIHYKRS